MKICPVCQMGNSDQSILCKECNASLGAATIQDEDVILKAQSDQYERNEKRRQRRLRNLKAASVILPVALQVSFFISIIRGNFFFLNLFLLFMPAVGYLMIAKMEILFQLKIDMSVDFNITGEVRPSEYFLLKTYVSAAALILVPIVVMGVVAFR